MLSLASLVSLWPLVPLMPEQKIKVFGVKSTQGSCTWMLLFQFLYSLGITNGLDHSLPVPVASLFPRRLELEEGTEKVTARNSIKN